jgi:hypothetical protein
MSKLQTTMMLLAGLGALALTPAVRAQGHVSWSQRTVFTFSGPVEIPGQVLPAGTYVFKLANSSSNRNIVQVFNKDENHLFGMFLAVPDYRLHKSDKTIVRFEERPAGSPPAIKAWFNPRRNEGHEFVYPKTRAIELAKANHTPVPAMPTELKLATINPTGIPCAVYGLFESRGTDGRRSRACGSLRRAGQPGVRASTRAAR